MASVNGNDFLTDPTGSRRFLPFEVEHIDIDAAKGININKVYSEAVELWRVDYHYWFNEEEIAELHQESEGFQVQTVEYEMLLKGMEKPAVTEESYMTTSEILNYLRGYTTLNLSERRMGEALKKAGFLRKSKRIGGNPMYVYHIRKISTQRIIAMTGCIKVHSEMTILQVSKLIITKIYGMTLPLMKVGVL